MNKITVIGLGPGSEEQISIGTLKLLKTSSHIYLRTNKHPVVKNLKEWEIVYSALDLFYENGSFESVYEKIADYLIEHVYKYGEIVYAVPGSPLVAEDSVKVLRQKVVEKGNISIDIHPALSFLDEVYKIINIDPGQGLQIIDALSSIKNYHTDMPLLICQVYNRLIASDAKLSLLEFFPPEHTIQVISAAGVAGQEKVLELPLYQLDHVPWIDYLTTVYIPSSQSAKPNSAQFPLDPLVNVMERLLRPDGCPWDRKQSHKTLKKYLLEEAYEVLEAIDEGNMYKLCEELGDLLLQVVFHAALAETTGSFSINDVVEGITDKMIRRHPHVFADVKVSDAQDVLVNWEAIKAKEKGKEVSKSLLGSVPKDLPALMHALEIQNKAAGVGFDWPDVSGAWAKIFEEIDELKNALDNAENASSNDEIYNEIGDLLFAVVNVARFANVNPEESLLATIRKFRKRFAYIENKIQQSGKNIKEFSLEELDKWWEEAKK
ncbi:MAG: nucleoside triphosphate pyrophosphohydrolase [Bacillota bacterium]